MATDMAVRTGFTIRLPLSMPPGHDLKDVGPPARAIIAGHACSLTKQEDRFVLEVDGFDTEHEAKRFLPTLGAGLLWAAISRGVGLIFTLNVGTVAYPDDPEQAARNLKLSTDDAIEASADARETVIYRSDKHLRCGVVGTPSLSLPSDPADFLALVNAGTALPNAAVIANDDKLRLAIDIYCLSQCETSPNARFLALVTALEILAAEMPRPDIIVQAIDRWKEEALRLSKDQEEEDIVASIKALLAALDNFKQESITMRIKSLVRSTLSAHGDPSATKFATQAAEHYTKRSKLTHTGRVDLGDAVSSLQEIVRRLLEAKMTGPLAAPTADAPPSRS